MVDIKKKEVDSEETNKSSSIEIKKIDLTQLAIDLIKILITEHFWGSVILLSIGGIGYLIHTHSIDLNLLFNLSNLSFNINNSILILLGVIILCIITFIANKVVSLIHNHEFIQSINKLIIEECKEIKLEIDNLSKILSTLQLMHEDLSKSINSLLSLLDNEIASSSKIREYLSSINNIIQKVPNKETILQLLVIRSRLIYNDITGIILDYIDLFKALSSSSSLFSNINKSKLSYMEEKFIYKFEETKMLYINDVYLYSKNTFDKNAEIDIVELLDTTLNEVKKLVLSNNDSIELLFAQIKDKVDVFVISATSIFESNLKLVTLFE